MATFFDTLYVQSLNKAGGQMGAGPWDSYSGNNTTGGMGGSYTEYIMQLSEAQARGMDALKRRMSGEPPKPAIKVMPSIDDGALAYLRARAKEWLGD